jgi:hypothetical protein
VEDRRSLWKFADGIYGSAPNNKNKEGGISAFSFSR